MSLNSGLLAFYRLSDATDEVGAIDLTETGGPAYAAGKIGDALNIAGGGDRLTSLDSIFALDGPVSKTLAGWVKFDSFANAPGVLSNWANGGGGVVQWLLYHDGSNLVFQVRDGSAADHIATWPTALSTGTWYFFVATYNSATGVVSLNVNDGTPVTSASPAATVNSGTTSFELGGRNNGAATLDGMIDAVGIWDRVLSSTEQTELYNGATGLEAPFTDAVPPAGAGLVYNFDFL